MMMMMIMMMMMMMKMAIVIMFLTQSSNSCKYYLPCEFSNVVGRIPLRNKLFVFHLNARSLVNKLTELHILLESLDYSFDVIVITETWEITYTTDLLNIPNYTRVSNMRSDGKMGGGVVLFIKDCIDFKINEAYNLTTADAVSVDIFGYNNKKH